MSVCTNPPSCPCCHAAVNLLTSQPACLFKQDEAYYLRVYLLTPRTYSDAGFTTRTHSCSTEQTPCVSGCGRAREQGCVLRPDKKGRREKEGGCCSLWLHMLKLIKEVVVSTVTFVVYVPSQLDERWRDVSGGRRGGIKES